MDRREKIESRLRRKKRIRKKIAGTAARPRLCVFKSLKNMYAQIVDDTTGRVITGVSTLTSRRERRDTLRRQYEKRQGSGGEHRA